MLQLERPTMKFKPAFISLLFFLAISSHDVPAKELRPSNDISCYLSNDCVFKKASPPEQSFPLSSIEDYLPCREGYDYFQPQPLNNPPRLCSRYGLNDFETESMPCDITDRICQSAAYYRSACSTGTREPSDKRGTNYL